MSVSDVTQVIGLLFVVATFVWGAATIKSSVDALRETVLLTSAQGKETQATVNAQSVEIAKMSVDISNLKDRAYKK